MAVQAIRGAIQVDANERDLILQAIAELVQAVLDRNGLPTDDLISVLFSATPNLEAEFPAFAQLVASALAARLAGEPDAVLDLAGHGMRDMTRIAGSDPALWAEIPAASAAPLAAELDALAGELRSVADALRRD